MSLRITIDRKTLQGNTVTVRYRDSMAQEQLPIDNVGKLVKEQTNIATLLSKVATLVVAAFAAMKASTALVC